VAVLYTGIAGKVMLYTGCAWEVVLYTDRVRKVILYTDRVGGCYIVLYTDRFVEIFQKYTQDQGGNISHRQVWRVFLHADRVGVINPCTEMIERLNST
jgi:hypothetical protein